MITDIELLSRYAKAGSETAFGELVCRHTDLVYATGLRLVNGDEHLAADVAQSVFSDLARKAAELCRQRPDKTGTETSRNLSLAGWLYTSTRFAACKAVRAEQTRRKHEQEAQVMDELLKAGSQEPDWAELRPVLEEAMSKLAEPERDAVLLRFFEGKDLCTVGAMLGVNEEAARKRVTRSLDKLRELLAMRGVTSTAAALSATLASHAVQAAPSGLAATLTSGSLAAAAAMPAASHLALGFLKLMTSIKLKLGLAALLAAAAATPLVLQRQTNRELGAANGQLQQTNRELGAANGQLQEEVERLHGQLASRPVAQTASGNSPEHLELLRLRGQLGRLRHEMAAKEALSSPAKAPQGLSETQMANLAEPQEWRVGRFLPKERISNLGLATPEAAVQTYLWALLQEDPTVAQSVLGEHSRVNLGVMREEFADRLGVAAGVHFDGYSTKDGSYAALISVQHSDDSELSRRVQMSSQDGSWRVIDDQWTPTKVLRPTQTQQHEEPEPAQ